MAKIQPPTHPLLIPLVLESIFKDFGVSDFKTFRQVNKVWYETATVPMRRAVTVKIGLESEAEADSELEEVPVDRYAIPRFLDLVQSETSTFERVPFANHYELHRVLMDGPEFWGSCGSSVKTLKLYKISFDSADSFRHAIFQSCPNLEELVLSDVKVAGSENEEEPLVWAPPQFPQIKNLKRLEFSGSFQFGGISFLELFSYFPSLEDLTVKLETYEHASRIFQAFATCRQHDPQSWKLTSIHFNIKPVKEPESDLQFLLDENLPLENLTVDCVETPAQCSVIKSILSANATTLKVLKLKTCNLEDIFEVDFDSALARNKDFTLNWFYGQCQNFIRNLPKLKKFELSRVTFHNARGPKRRRGRSYRII